ncbi:MAG: transcriptional repressor general negative regulator of transcription subunit 4 [Caeruleum heppii]|nr:MAG: transcriptional repressor general negative regulator of transcription subunit 4 [Caeruleum heppii]
MNSTLSFPALPQQQSALSESGSTRPAPQTKLTPALPLVAAQVKPKGSDVVRKDSGALGKTPRIAVPSPTLLSQKPTSKPSKEDGEAPSILQSAPDDKTSTIDSKMPRPGKLDIAAATDRMSDQTRAEADTATPIEPEKLPKSAVSAGLTSLPSMNNSRSNSPSVSSSRDQDFPALRAAPKTIRLVSTPKTETPNPMSVLTSSPATAASPASKLHSRKPSVASMARPATPASEMNSDNISMTSASMSRANSPPPSKVGSAPQRVQTKSQQKKQRKEAKKEMEKTEPVEAKIAVPAEEKEIAPILGRKKKQKSKPVSGTADDVTAPSAPVSPAGKGQQLETQTAEPKVSMAPPKKGVQETTKMEETEATEPVSAVEASQPRRKSATAADIIAEMIASGHLDPSHAVLKPPPNVHQRFDFSAADLADFERSLTLTNEDLAALTEGRSVRIPFSREITDDGEKASVDDRGVLVTPGGDVLRGLSPEQEGRYLELEQRIGTTSGAIRFTSARQMSGEGGFSIVGGRVLYNGPMSASHPSDTGSIVTHSDGAGFNVSTDPANKVRINGALGYINQFVLPALPNPKSSRPSETPGGKGGSSRANASANDPVERFISGKGVLQTGKAPDPIDYTPYIGPSVAAGSSDDVVSVMQYMATGGAANNPDFDAVAAGYSAGSLGGVGGLQVHTGALGGPNPASILSPSSTMSGSSGPLSSGQGSHKAPATTVGLPTGLPTGLPRSLPSVPLMAADEAESTMQTARREAEALEKRLNTLVKKNRKLVMSAASAVAASGGKVVVTSGGD